MDNRLEGARIILKGMATPGTEEKVLDLAVTVEQLNSLETEGFMAHMKFEGAKTFRVGDTKIDGSGVTLIGYENSFIFNIVRSTTSAMWWLPVKNPSNCSFGIDSNAEPMAA